MSTVEIVCILVGTVIAAVTATASAFYLVLTLVVKNAIAELHLAISKEYTSQDACRAIRSDCHRH